MQVSNKEIHCAEIKEPRKERLKEAHGTFMFLEANGVFCQVTHKKGPSILHGKTS